MIDTTIIIVDSHFSLGFDPKKSGGSGKIHMKPPCVEAA